MPCYVDNAIYPFGRMVMCHLTADTPNELHAMAAKIGVARKWFQEKASFPHYDICKSKRALAIKYGAIEWENRRQLVEFMRRVKPVWDLL